MEIEILNNKEDNTEGFKPGSLYIMTYNINRGSIAVFCPNTKYLQSIGGDGDYWNTPRRSQWRELPAGTLLKIKDGEE